MSKTRILVWAHFPESADVWHDTHIAEATTKLSAQTYHWEYIDNPYRGVKPSLEAPFLTIYEVPDTGDYEELERKLRIDQRSAFLRDVRFDTRCYTEVKRVECENYEKAKRAMEHVIVATWRPNEATKEKFFKWFFDVFMPAVTETPTVICSTVYKRTHATIFENGAYRPATDDEALTYVSVCETTTEELPWDVLAMLGQTDGWREHVDGDLVWKIGQYALLKSLPETTAITFPIDSGCSSPN
ncbi:hypothetical protein P280DRAFT_171482 [Massarina eburnea CBS 473.64]|uniref:EthD domain-containing protein n=1 Tax=Massarina eburnea CBS 473.64 TaxID=1395130 RepID=A0A6A6SAZ7_9PLEO|nr:hypothetical protein P280DRAFT_171482 [Massarina eburnea CBS 473.64]